MPIFLETSILRYGLLGKARTRPEIFRVDLGPCALFTHARHRTKNGTKHQNYNQNI